MLTYEPYRPTYEEFLRSHTSVKKDGTRKWDRSPSCDAYRDMGFEDGYKAHLAHLDECDRRSAKIHEFEAFLRKLVVEKKAQYQRSNISESRYYYWQGTKYRFSAHFYPTGSMTDIREDAPLRTIDFASDPELIDTVNF